MPSADLSISLQNCKHQSNQIPSYKLQTSKFRLFKLKLLWLFLHFIWMSGSFLGFALCLLPFSFPKLVPTTCSRKYLNELCSWKNENSHLKTLLQKWQVLFFMLLLHISSYLKSMWEEILPLKEKLLLFWGFKHEISKDMSA